MLPPAEPFGSEVAMSGLGRVQVVSLLLAAVVAAAPGAAGEGSVGVDVEAVSQYVWRGVVLDDGWSLQPALHLNWDFDDATGVEVLAWFNAALETHGSPTHQDELFENDLTLTAWRQLGGELQLYGGGTYYGNPFSDVEPGSEPYSTTELFVGLGWGEAPLTLESTLYWDVDAVDGAFLELVGGYSLDLNAAMSLEPSVNVGLASGQGPDDDDPEQGYWYSDDGLVTGGAGLALSFAPSDTVTLAATVSYARRFDDPEGQDRDLVWASLKLELRP